MERTSLFQFVSRHDTPNFYLNREVKSEETLQCESDADQHFEKESQQWGNEYGRAVRL